MNSCKIWQIKFEELKFALRLDNWSLVPYRGRDFSVRCAWKTTIDILIIVSTYDLRECFFSLPSQSSMQWDGMESFPSGKVASGWR
jgi:hypothetical protein